MRKHFQKEVTLQLSPQGCRVVSRLTGEEGGSFRREQHMPEQGGKSREVRAGMASSKDPNVRRAVGIRRYL